MIGLRTLSSLTALVAAAAGCEPPQNQPRLRDEAVAIEARYEAQFDDLRHRADDVDQHRTALPHDTLSSASAEHSLSRARLVIEDERGYLKTVRKRLAGMEAAPPVELQMLIDDLRHRLDAAATEATAEIAAVEAWAAVTERERAAAGSANAEPPEPAAPAGPTTPAADEPRPPEVDRTGAPIR